jgi:hypothetical protein
VRGGRAGKDVSGIEERRKEQRRFGGEPERSVHL